MHGLLYMHAHKHAHTLLTVPRGRRQIPGLGGDYPKHKNDGITKQWCNPAVNHISLANEFQNQRKVEREKRGREWIRARDGNSWSGRGETK